ncbi:phage portal protein, partial [Salmonella enterica subsp. enterica serovar Anatum]|nr:phage portal protein [Salmonella enterica subsp. enterica serovar Anatum]
MKKRKYRERRTVTRQRHMSLITLGKPEPILTTGTKHTEDWHDNE